MLMSLGEMGNVVDQEFLARVVGFSVAGYISSRYRLLTFARGSIQTIIPHLLYVNLAQTLFPPH